jgi:hypothetical protein
MTPARTSLLALLAVVSLAGTASAQRRPPPPPPPPVGEPDYDAADHRRRAGVPADRPRLEVTSWVGVGGGAIHGDGASKGIFDLRLGGDFTAGISADENVRIGPFAEISSGSFASVNAVTGVELLLAASPRPLRMFYYSGEGTFALRLGAGYGARHELPGASQTAVASVTVAYGYRCPFSLREPSRPNVPRSTPRPTARYMVGVRLWLNALVDVRRDAAWQLSGGLEFEPVGSGRYVFGL